jgi:hypothetical protein
MNTLTRQKERAKMYDIVDSIPEMDGCNIIAVHMVEDYKKRRKIVLIADNEDKEIFKVDIYATPDGPAWDISKKTFIRGKNEGSDK